MADRYAFQSPFSRGHGSDPWFTVGNVAVTTTVAVTALGVLGILLFVVEGGFGPLNQALVLSDDVLLRGHVWRLVTYIIPTSSGFFFGLLSLLFFYMIGSQFEAMLGRRAFSGLFFSLLLVPAILAVVVSVLVGQGVPILGLSMVFLGIAAGFSAAMPEARSFFGIPFWVLVAFIFVIQLLSVLASRSIPGLVMLLSTGAIGLIVTRSLGFSNVEWIPAVKLPGVVSGEATPTPQAAKPAKKRGKRFGRKKKAGNTNLRSVPTGPAASASDAEIDALLEQVSEEGVGSLTKQQKQTLERHSKELRKRRDG